MLGFEGGCRRSLGRRERDEEGVALSVDFYPVPCGQGRSQHSSMLGERLRVRIRTERVQQARRALDVGEEERDGAGREVPAHGRVIDGAVTSRASE